MTPRERVLVVLNGQRPDRVPWFGDLDYWATALIGRGQKPLDFKTSMRARAVRRTFGSGLPLRYFTNRINPNDQGAWNE